MATEEQQNTTDPLRPNVRTFKPSSFQASQFEVVAEGTASTEFSLDQFTVVGAQAVVVDPMFDVYDQPVGGTSSDESPFVLDLEVEQEGASSEEVSAGDDAGSPDEDAPVQMEEATVPVSEVELLQQGFEEERRALLAEHERHVEEVKGVLQQELSAQYAAESEEKLRIIEERYRALVDDMGTQIRQEVEAVERRAVDFALQVARKLVGTIVEINPEYVLQVIQEAVKLTGGATIKSIKVSPQDLEFIKMLSPERQFKEFDGSWSFQSDDTIRAGCVVETSSGQVEFDLDKTWERIKESVTKVR
jgi:flagellar biosynthesis/type III secretory pathway protein FliH